MKYIFAFVLVFMFAFAGFAGTASASCGDVDPVTNQVIQCGNGPIVAQKPGGRFLSAGQEDCPWWFPQMFGHACYTMRAVGVPFIPLN